jgi:HSP20 family molecular chaperone IbpA
MAQESMIEKRETDTTQPEQMRGGRTYIPNVDIVEQANEILILADVPGVQPNGVDIHYERGELTLHGKVAARQDPETTDYLLQEYGVGDFYRRFVVGEGIDESQIEAELRGGVLTVHLPKAQEVMPRRITVKTA